MLELYRYRLVHVVNLESVARQEARKCCRECDREFQVEGVPPPWQGLHLSCAPRLLRGRGLGEAAELRV